MPPKPITDAEKYHAKVVIPSDTSECWGWIGSRDHGGYATLSGGTGRSPIKAHRVSYEIYIGPIPSGMDICHRCDNPPCTNPSHLFPGTAADNMADMIQKGRQRQKAKYDCQVCGKSGIGYVGKRYCSSTCRVTAHRWRMRARGYVRNRDGWHRRTA